MLRVVPDYVHAQDIDPTPVWRALGLAEVRDALDTADRVPAVKLADALAVAARLCRDPMVSLRIGMFVRPAHMGALGYALMSCGEAREGLALYEQMQSLVCNELRSHHHIARGLLETRHDLLGPVPRDTGFWTFYAASRLAFARWVSARDLIPLRVDLPCPPPADPAALQQFIGGPVRYDTPDYREVIPADWLNWLNPNADPSVHGLMSSMATRQWEATLQQADEVVVDLTQRITASLNTGAVPTLDTLARPGLGGLSARQLQRRLAERGLSFSDLLEQVRREQALNHLRHTELPLAEVAQRAGYAEPSSFHRAVKRWTGLTPLAVREQSRGSS